MLLIVTEVQLHSKKSCKKGNKDCQYGSLKAPVKDTFLSRPLAWDDDSDQNETEKESENTKE